jgi:uncharacterized protein involved in exopolysaccharide biosynthesis
MSEPVDLRLYLRHLTAHWRTLLAVPAAAALIAAGVSLILPKKYDATATLLIQPGASDPRFPPALNQVYLEYLRSYEHLVQGDELLSRVLKEFRLDQPPDRFTVESFRRRALKAELLKYTKILAVRVRLDDPQKAHLAAQFLAREAVKVTERLRDAEIERSVQQAAQDRDQARKRLDDASGQLLAYRLKAREEEWTRQVQALRDQREEQQKQLATLLADGAENEARRMRLRRALQESDGPLARAEAQLYKAQAGAVYFERDYELARQALAAAETRVSEARQAASVRSEILQLVDPGVAPQRHSSPNLGLNVLVAVALGLIAAAVYETWMFGSTAGAS